MEREGRSISHLSPGKKRGGRGERNAEVKSKEIRDRIDRLKKKKKKNHQSTDLTLMNPKAG